KVEIVKGEMVEFNRMVPIPSVIPSFNCPIITFIYYLKIKLTTSRILRTTTVSARLPVIIGTIPPRQVSTPPSRQVSIPPSREASSPSSLSSAPRTRGGMGKGVGRKKDEK
ncbi:hypothetical protein PMAYCL1PPCAC_24822, partial [Pristionchus mayeri]